MDTTNKYDEDWVRLTGNAFKGDNLVHLRRDAVRGVLRECNFRSIYWALLLGVFDHDMRQWSEQRHSQRMQYRSMKKNLEFDPSHVTNTADHPLSKAQQSTWNRFFCDQELYSIIRQDIVRTFPGVEFFRRDEIQQKMIDILFCYARQNGQLSYRQGMHEILGPVLFVIDVDQRKLPNHVTDMRRELLDDAFLEEDSYCIFVKIMSHIGSTYRIKNICADDGDNNLSPTRNSPDEKPTEVEIAEQLHFIQTNILRKHDPRLNSHLQSHDIALSIFGIRWLRLLFGREFSLPDLLILWDAIFATGFRITNFIMVAMLIEIRDKLFTDDYASCLQYLMHYPSNVDVRRVICTAIELKSCKMSDKDRGIPPPSAIHQSIRQSAVHRRRRNVSAPVNGSGTALAAMRVASRGDDGIVSGLSPPNYLPQRRDNVSKIASVNDLKQELWQAKLVMGATEQKLVQCLSVLRANLPQNASREVDDALRTIERLCATLRYGVDPPTVHLLVPVERAAEAIEVSRVTTTSPSPPKTPQQKTAGPAATTTKLVEMSCLDPCRRDRPSKYRSLPSTNPTGERGDA